MGDVVDSRIVEYQRGQRLWRAGRPRPPSPEACGDPDVVTPSGWLWMGWMTARGCDYMDRVEIARRVAGDDAAERIRPEDNQQR